MGALIRVAIPARLRGGSGDLEPYGALRLDTGQASGRAVPTLPTHRGRRGTGTGVPEQLRTPPGPEEGEAGGGGGPFPRSRSPPPRGPRFPGARTRVGGPGLATWTGQLGPLAPIRQEPAPVTPIRPGHAPTLRSLLRGSECGRKRRGGGGEPTWLRVGVGFRQGGLASKRLKQICFFLKKKALFL